MTIQPEPTRRGPNRAQWTFATIVVLFGVCVVLTKVLRGVGLGQSAAFYMGLPLVLALLMVLMPNSGNAYGMVLKAVTICLLLSIPVLGEGFVCVLFIAPLAYAIPLLVVAVVRLSKGRHRRMQVVAVPALLAVMALEGVTPELAVDGNAEVSATRTVEATSAQVEAALAEPLGFGEPSGVLALGFPRPLMDHGSALRVGERRVVMFDGAHHRMPLMKQHHWGTEGTELVFEISARTPTSVRMRVLSDATPIATWLHWRQVEIRWESVDSERTAITWVLDYERQLAPAWYFGPLERFVAGRAANYLLDSLDLPA